MRIGHRCWWVRRSWGGAPGTMLGLSCLIAPVPRPMGLPEDASPHHRRHKRPLHGGHLRASHGVASGEPLRCAHSVWLRNLRRIVSTSHNSNSLPAFRGTAKKPDCVAHNITDAAKCVREPAEAGLLAIACRICVTCKIRHECVAVQKPPAALPAAGLEPAVDTATSHPSAGSETSP